MKHLGDITQISGYEAPVVDVIIGGSPCQDLSIAGKRAGLAGARSGLYMEQIRIIKEMRERDRRDGKPDVDVRPRYMVWENVPGAFSTNQGKDFAAVLEEAIRVAEPEAPDVSVPEKGWPASGCLFDVDGRWSVAWRILDAQFWGTSDKPLPQRRRRIALVADFGGLSAPEILFVRKGVSGDIEPGKPKGKEAPGDAGEGVGGANTKGLSVPTYCIQGNAIDRADTAGCNGKGWTEGKCYTLNTIDRPAVVAVGFDAYNQSLTGDVAKPLTNSATDSDHIPLVIENHPADSRVNINKSGVVQTLTSRMGTGGGNVPMVMEELVCMDAGLLNCRQAKSPPLLSRGYKDPHVVCGTSHIVRRLTPLECERLQGFPDGWTDIGEWVDSKGKKHKEADSPRYKALGNSVAIPPWKWVLKRLCACYERDATMASLFDGIGGFPYIWQQFNGKGSCLWASEIEEFPMAVTRLRFGG